MSGIRTYARSSIDSLGKSRITGTEISPNYIRTFVASATDIRPFDTLVPV